MPPRKTTDFGALFESLIEDLRVQVAASVDRSMTELQRRVARIERRLDQLDPAHAESDATAGRRSCSLCERGAVARGLCSAHYQQWRYRERKVRLVSRAEAAMRERGLTEDVLPSAVAATAPVIAETRGKLN